MRTAHFSSGQPAGTVSPRMTRTTRDLSPRTFILALMAIGILAVGLRAVYQPADPPNKRIGRDYMARRGRLDPQRAQSGAVRRMASGRVESNVRLARLHWSRVSVVLSPWCRLATGEARFRACRRAVGTPDRHGRSACRKQAVRIDRSCASGNQLRVCHVRSCGAARSNDDRPSWTRD